MIHPTIKRILSPIWRRLRSRFGFLLKTMSAKGYARNPYYFVSRPVQAAPQEQSRIRINMLLPSVKSADLTGGPATLLNYTLALAERIPGCAVRFLPTFVPVNGKEELPAKLAGYALTRLPATPTAATAGEVLDREIIADVAYRNGCLPIGKNDIFIASMWPTHYTARALQKEQARLFSRAHKLQYVIQDYEPSALYPWSDLFILARNTYTDTHNTIAVVGTASLAEYLKLTGHHYQSAYSFPVGTNVVKTFPIQEKEKLIIIYGRPTAERNCFSLIMEILIELTSHHPQVAREWQFISVGDKHEDYPLAHGAKLVSRGFLPAQDYRDLLQRAAIGCFFVVSPHTGYIAFEMACAGQLTISNSFETKDMRSLHPNIREPLEFSVEGYVDEFLRAIRDFDADPQMGNRTAQNYADAQAAADNSSDTFSFITEMLAKEYVFD